MNANRKRHRETAKRAPPSGREGRNFKQRDLYKVPEPLMMEIVASMGDQLYIQPYNIYRWML